jgi:predicted small secreted protein
MKKIIAIVPIVALLSVGNTQAQTKEGVGTKVKKTAKTVGNKVAETVSKGSSRVVDKVYKDKIGPDGQTIYINNESKYYWVDKSGHRVYVTTDQLKDKPKDQ